MCNTYMADPQKISSQVKRGSAELVVLAVLAETRLHGYEIAKRIRQRTGGIVSFDVASLYPVLYAMERRGWVKGEWEQAANGRRRRYYRLTPDGRRRLKPLRREWRDFFRALNRLTRLADA